MQERFYLPEQNILVELFPSLLADSLDFLPRNPLIRGNPPGYWEGPITPLPHPALPPPQLPHPHVNTPTLAPWERFNPQSCRTCCRAPSSVGFCPSSKEWYNILWFRNSRHHLGWLYLPGICSLKKEQGHKKNPSIVWSIGGWWAGVFQFAGRQHSFLKRYCM